jgi:hypothetical protein
VCAATTLNSLCTRETGCLDVTTLARGPTRGIEAARSEEHVDSLVLRRVGAWAVSGERAKLQRCGCGRPKSDHPAFVARTSPLWYGSSTARCAAAILRSGRFFFLLLSLLSLFFVYSLLSACEKRQVPAQTPHPHLTSNSRLPHLTLLSLSLK